MKRLGLAVVAAAALWPAACGGGGSSVTPPPPTGNFSAASLNGQYAFVTSGEVFTPGSISATPLSRTGSFTADGQGHITGGVEDVNAAGTVTNAIPITGGSYIINPDGRGTLSLSFGSNTLQFGITLTSTSTGDGLLIDETFTTNQASTGSGNFFKQNTASFTAPVPDIAGPYVFDFSGLDGNQTFPCPCPESFVGEFTASNGGISSGLFDDNDNGAFVNGTVTGTFAQDPLHSATLSGAGRGVALIAGQNFVFYIVDSTRVRFLSTNGGMLSGDAVAQANVPAGLSGEFVFVVAGSSGNGGLTRVGRFTLNGSTATNVLVDTNNAGAFTQTTGATNTNIALDSTTGRGTVTFLGNGLSTPFNFVFYINSATQGVIQETTQSTQGVAAAVADGSIAAQSGSPFTSGNVNGAYAFNWSGLSIQNNGSFAAQDEEDLVGQASVSGLNLSGAADIFQFQSAVGPKGNLGVGGSITIRGDGTGGDGQRSTISVNLTGANPINFVVYFVNPQLAFFVNTSTSSTRIVVGILKAQQ